MKIDIKSNKEQKEDIATYYNMIDCLCKKINEAGLHMSWIDMRGDRKHSKRSKIGSDPAVLVHPSNRIGGRYLLARRCGNNRVVYQ